MHSLERNSTVSIAAVFFFEVDARNKNCDVSLARALYMPPGDATIATTLSNEKSMNGGIIT